MAINGYWWLLGVIILKTIGGYSINDCWWFIYEWLLAVILLLAISFYFINDYWWLLMVIILAVISGYSIVNIGGY